MPRLSTGLRNAMAGNYGLGAMMNGGVIRVFQGSRPSSPDQPHGSTELARITTEGRTFIPVTDPYNAGLLLSVVSPGGLVNQGNWHLRGVATGTAQWWRWNWSGEDTQGQSSAFPRVDGLVGENLILPYTSINPNTFMIIEQFLFVLGQGN